MSATRTQVYLTEEQRQQIDALASAEGITMAEVVRRALDAYLGAQDASAALTATFGAVPDLTVPSRAEWDKSRDRGEDRDGDRG
jgi:hypothetical protein